MGNNTSVASPAPPQYNVPIGNWTQYVDGSVNGQTSSAFLVTTGGPGGDPAVGCPKEFTANYQCGNNAPKEIKIDPEAAGHIAPFDCTAEDAKCSNFKLTVEDTGNLVMTNSAGGVVWQSNTSATGLALDKYKASNGKYGRNYLTGGETLNVGEFVGSPSGNCFLIMESSGLNLSYAVEDCTMISDSVGYGNSANANALYGTPKISTDSIGKVGYVTDGGTLREYPNSMLKQGTTYFPMGSYDSPGNDISSFANSSADDCKSRCNADDSCAGFVFNTNSSTCYTKNDGMFPKGLRVQSKDAELYIRSKGVANNATCTKDIDSTTSATWQLFPTGQNMSLDTLCQLGFVTQKERKEMADAQQELSVVKDQLSQKLSNLSQEDARLIASLGYNIDKLEKDLHQYDKVRSDTLSAKAGFQNASGMKDDSELQMVSDNYHYLMWSILAILIVAGGIKATRQ